jgi:hypothetical protein
MHAARHHLSRPLRPSRGKWLKFKILKSQEALIMPRRGFGRPSPLKFSYLHSSVEPTTATILRAPSARPPVARRKDWGPRPGRGRPRSMWAFSPSARDVAHRRLRTPGVVSARMSGEERFPGERQRSLRFKTMVCWFLADALIDWVLLRHPALEYSYWMIVLYIPGVMFLWSAWLWVKAVRQYPQGRPDGSG